MKVSVIVCDQQFHSENPGMEAPATRNAEKAGKNGMEARRR